MSEKLGKARAIMYVIVVAALIAIALLRILPHHH